MLPLNIVPIAKQKPAIGNSIWSNCSIDFALKFFFCKMSSNYCDSMNVRPSPVVPSIAHCRHKRSLLENITHGNYSSWEIHPSVGSHSLDKSVTENNNNKVDRACQQSIKKKNYMMYIWYFSWMMKGKLNWQRLAQTIRMLATATLHRTTTPIPASLRNRSLCLNTTTLEEGQLTITITQTSTTIRTTCLGYENLQVSLWGATEAPATAEFGWT